MTDHVRMKHKIRRLKEEEFRALLEASLLTPKEKEIMLKIYVEHKPLGYIADDLGYSESTVRLKHRQAISLLAEFLL